VKRISRIKVILLSLGIIVISLWATMLIEASRVVRLYVFFSHLRSDTPTKLSYWGGIMKVRQSQDCMDSSMKSKEDIKFLFGNNFIIASIICHLLLWLMKKLCACMVEFLKICTVFSKLSLYPNLLMFLMLVLLQTFSGMILMKMSEIGRKTKEDVDLYSVANNLKNSLKDMILT